ncbi:hypothetical protein SESBI_48898 [Sesbania bispinosa]|nr:hypothetical protein SESBI_48898 [Sesbania bispinosa]
MDSGNSGSISSSGDEEYDSRPHHTILPSTFLNQTPFNPQQQSSLLSSSHQHHSLFDLSSTYLHPFSQPQPNSSNPNSFLNLDTGTQRSEPNCTGGVGGGASSSSASALNHCLLAPSPSHQGLGGQCVTDPSLQLRPIHDDNNARASLSSSTNVVRNPKKRTRASRRAPTTVLTTDTSNFRAMVQEFTGIPAPPFSGGFNAKSQSGLSIPSLEDLQGVNQGQVNNNNNAHLVGSGSGGSGVSVVPSVHQHDD